MAMSAIRNRQIVFSDQFFVWSVVLLAWVLAVLATLASQDWLLNHDILIEESTLPWLLTFFLFIGAWQVMTGGMMLPSSLPMMRLFAQASRGQSRPQLLLLVFLGAYFAVWTGFAILAFIGDTGLHWLINHWAWLDQRSWLIAGGSLLIAGGFQFSPLKERCLHECRSPRTFLWRHYQRGAGAAWVLGIRHAIFCLGCCWALMLVMFGLGVGNIAWMAGLTGVMLIEKTSRRGNQLVPVVGTVLVVWGLLVLIQPGWLPVALQGAR